MKDITPRSTKNQPGWLLKYLLALDDMFFGRWDYWLRALDKDKIPAEPIPPIHFQSVMTYSGHSAMKNLNECINYASHSHSNVVESFIDWILWGFNYRGASFPNIDDKTDDYWYRTFNLGLFYTEPGDYMAELAQNHNVGVGAGFFATPMSVVEMMVKMTMGGEPRPYHKSKSVLDPCCGTGGMLLYASNYSLNLYGNDINPLLCKMAMVNAFIYMPWVVCRPKEHRMFEREQESRILEIETPEGFTIPECIECGNRRNFLLEVLSEHELISSPAGLVEISQPRFSSEAIGKRLNLDNLICAPCLEKKETP